jgi:uridine kinase
LKDNGKEVTLIQLKDFYKSYGDMINRWHIDYDDPVSLDWDLLQQVMENLITQSSYTMPIYDKRSGKMCGLYLDNTKKFRMKNPKTSSFSKASCRSSRKISAISSI